MNKMFRDRYSKEEKENLLRKLEFSEFFFDVSNNFLKHQPEDFEEWFYSCLKDMYVFFNPSFLKFYKFSKDKKTVRQYFSYDGKKSKHICLKSLSWFLTQVKEGEYIHTSNVNKLKNSQILTKFGFNSDTSFFFSPISGENSILGFLVLGYEKDKKLSELDISLLEKIGEFLSGAFKKHLTNKRIRDLTFHDNLTGLYNRVYLQEEMERLDTPRQLPITMIMADLNGLKLVNDTFGHRAGDKLLKKTAEILTESFRQEDIITRWGGDEFIIFLPKTLQSEAQKICDRVQQNCEKSFVEDIPVSIALGLAQKDKPGKTLNKVLKEADYNMYKNKVARRKKERRKLIDTILQSLAKKSHETDTHIAEMQKIALKIGEKLELPKAELKRLYLAIKLHDIGKINLSEKILMKNTPLNEKELEFYKQHPEVGYRIITATEEYIHVAKDVLCHHECWDGSGYPNGLEGDEIPLLAQILSISGFYEIMKNGRFEKPPMSESEIILNFQKSSGKNFDPKLVNMFFDIIANYE